MGHLTRLKAEYQALVDRLDAGQVGVPEPDQEAARIARKEILEILFTPEEAEIASRIPILPSRIEDIARRTRIPVADLRPKLDRMADRGLVLDLMVPGSDKTLWVLAPPVVGFFEFSLMRVNEAIPQKRLAQAFEAYFHDEAFVKEVFGHQTMIGRALVHETTLDDDLPEVLPYERATALVADAKDISVSLCFCPTWICSCCACCCEQLGAIQKWDLRAVTPSGFEPRWDTKVCKGCSRCARHCPVGAITMRAVRVDARRRNDLRPEIDLDRCIGCGICTDECKNDGMRMVRRQKRHDVPLNLIERSVRMALERGRLAELLVDQGASRGSRFLGAVVKALTRLPVAERALASEQVRSRFVQAALARVRDPS